MAHLKLCFYSSVVALPIIMLQCDSSRPITIGGETSDKLFPPDSGIINVKTVYGAKGDGTSDDTQALLNAIRANVGKSKTLYFPTGTYLVSNRLDWLNTNGIWQSHLMFQGQNRATTIIKLKDNAPGYSDPNQPKALIYTASHSPANATTGSGNNAFENSLYDLTIDTGVGNRGAIAIDYLANNMGTLSDVTIRSGDGQGLIGLGLQRYGPGPCLIKNVQIDGFDYGISAQNYEYGITFEHISLANQKISGIRNNTNVLSIRGLISNNSVPVIQNVSRNSFVTLVDSTLSGGSSWMSAIENEGGLYARNLVTSGYQSAIKQKGSIIAGSTHAEFVSHNSLSLFPSPQKALNLPVEETPSFHDNDFNNWANVKDFGAIANDSKNDSTAIQAAIDSGKTTIYFPHGRYNLSKTIKVRGQVRRIMGMASQIDIASNTTFNNPANPQPLFYFETGAQEAVIMERFNFVYTITGVSFTGGISIENASSKTVVLRDILTSSSAKYFYRNALGAGKLFIENVATDAPYYFEYPQDVWARQLNPESFKISSGPSISKRGGTFWILGLKTEGPRSVLETTNGGRTELLGGLLYPVRQIALDEPAFLNNESQLSLVYAVSANAVERNYSIHVKETRDGVIKTLLRSNIPSRGPGSLVPLYVGSN